MSSDLGVENGRGLIRCLPKLHFRSVSTAALPVGFVRSVSLHRAASYIPGSQLLTALIIIQRCGGYFRNAFVIDQVYSLHTSLSDEIEYDGDADVLTPGRLPSSRGTASSPNFMD
ncbi:hypothetical protein N7G274_003487 [Stereocaulon virgatum]|uniref:Uncharacterized protein n=1 Tax=Stereocaulon virgatum TaxID=373712 RepID=A0ABR4AH91_9LECA